MGHCNYCNTDKPVDKMASNPPNCCFRCKTQGISITKGQLVNHLYPGLTNKETTDQIVADGKAGGYDPIPVEKVWS